MKTLARGPTTAPGLWGHVLTVVFFAVLLHGDLHLSFGTLTVRVTICS